MCEKNNVHLAKTFIRKQNYIIKSYSCCKPSDACFPTQITNYTPHRLYKYKYPSSRGGAALSATLLSL